MPGELAAGLRRLIRHGEHVARQPERVAARDARCGRRQLIHEHRGSRFRDVDDAETALRRLVREVEDAPPVRQLLKGEPLAAVALAVQVVVPDQHHVARFGRALRHQRGTGQHQTHD